jgi:hypothetical protein
MEFYSSLGETFKINEGEERMKLQARIENSLVLTKDFCVLHGIDDIDLY